MVRIERHELSKSMESVRTAGTDSVDGESVDSVSEVSC